jgi:LacI family transcriptional regulator
MVRDVTTAKRKERATLTEIASAAGVSKSTVSLVLNSSSNIIPISEPTRLRVLEAARAMGYKPNAAARSLVTGRANTILMVVFGARDSHLVERVQGAESYLTPHRYPLHMCTVDTNNGLGAYLEIVRAGRADGVLLTGFATPDTYPLLRELHNEASELEKPVVAIANGFPLDCVEAVAQIDDAGGAEQLVGHLIEHGHRRIAMIGVADQPWCEDRVRGYRSALARAGVPYDPELVKLHGFDGDVQSRVYDTTLDLANSTDVTAMFVAQDIMAVAALAALRATGRRVPEDCALVGYDNDASFARFTDPPLTTIDNPFHEQGEMAARILVGMIEDKPVPAELLPVSLVIRESCGCRRAGGTR